ncbi:hypothetical protein [Streptomyces hyaluromycini]|uniref:hypothetical protein n=1 Tax=Streptomyces hyaluromycini TaxID=1377993 RepID=UPI0011AE6F9A|nr:hypothetical protein [Streptomyces hyaluromycini]
MASAHFEILIGDNDTAQVNGEPMFRDSQRPIHELVLDLLQGHARRLGAAVEAVIDSRPGLTTFRLEVAPDGSSRILTLDASSGAEEARQPLPETAEPAAAVKESASTGGTPVPARLLDRVRAINRAAADGDVRHALEMASALRVHLADVEGHDHAHTLEARAMEAYLAYLYGEHRQATVLALGVARIRCRDGDARVPDDLARATASWRRLEDDAAAVAHGHELLHMYDTLERQELLPSSHRELADLVRRHLHWLTSTP